MEDTKITLDGLGPKLFAISGAIGLLGLIATVALGMAEGDGMRHFGFAYLTNFAFFLAISLGALIFIPIMYVTKASWHIVMRRLVEVTAAVLPLMALLAIPVIVFAGKIYGWADPEVAASHALAHKLGYLNTNAFVIRLVIYFVIWTGYSWFYWKTSAKQDETGDLSLTGRLENFSGFGIMICALSIAGASMDLLMSLDPIWFSTMFGVYYWAGGFVSFFAVMTLFTLGLQRTGRLTGIISAEHLHDYGKAMFAFTFFWGYIAFSQYMLYWYGNIPEETVWFLVRSENGWGWVGLVTLFCTFMLPFAGLVSRFTKRQRPLLAFWAVWIIVAQWINLYWVVMPEFSESFVIGPMEILGFFGVGGIWLAGIVRLAMGHKLVPVKDPRLPASLRFENP
ncbi:quinol:cytochrome C oxidoreductase [bacterium DOLZORAL124_64_63]|nr:MAG: quinol:cytochrome C oxidoreductase [bacterium DOLZORAL124_64_63]